LRNIRMPRSTKTCCLAASHYLGRIKKVSGRWKRYSEPDLEIDGKESNSFQGG
jgi:hypothetical protein